MGGGRTGKGREDYFNEDLTALIFKGFEANQKARRRGKLKAHLGNEGLRTTRTTRGGVRRIDRTTLKL